MFSLIITIISIALVAALALATLYYGGEAFNEGRAKAEAAKLKNHGQQLLGAADLFRLEKGRYPNNVPELVSEGYLSSVPVAKSPVNQALAAEEWVMPTAQEPVFVFTGVEEETCAEFNVSAYGQNGILDTARTSQMYQCFGDTSYKAVVSKSTSAMTAAATAGNVVLADTEISSAPIPTDPSDSAWALAPTGATGGGSTVTPPVASGVIWDYLSTSGSTGMGYFNLSAEPPSLTWIGATPYSSRFFNIVVVNQTGEAITGFTWPDPGPQVDWAPFEASCGYVTPGNPLAAGASCNAQLFIPGPAETFLVNAVAGYTTEGGQSSTFVVPVGAVMEIP